MKGSERALLWRANSTGVSCDMLLLLPDNKKILRKEDQDSIIHLVAPTFKFLLSMWLQLLGYHTPCGTLLYKYYTHRMLKSMLVY